MSTEKKSMPQNQQRLALTCCAEFEKVVFIENSSCSSRSFMGCLLGIPITNSGKLVLIGQMVKTPPTAPCNVVIWSTACAVCSALHNRLALRVAIWVLTDKDTRRCRTPTIWFTALCCSFPGRAPQWRFSTVAPQWLFFFCCFKHNWSSCTIAQCTCLLYAPLHLGHTSHHAPPAVKSETMIRGFHLFKNVAAPLCTNRPQHCFEQLRLDALDLLEHIQPDANISVLQGHILQSYTPEFYNTLGELLWWQWGCGVVKRRLHT